MDHSKETDEHRYMRKVAFCAVVVSTVAVMSSVVTLPMVYSYVQSLQSHMMAEVEFCKVPYFEGAAYLLTSFFSVAFPRYVGASVRLAKFATRRGGVASPTQLALRSVDSGRRRRRRSH